MKKFSNLRSQRQQMKNQLSIQKNMSSVLKKKVPQTQPSIVVQSGTTNRYHLLLKNPFKLNPTDPQDPACLWKTLLPDATKFRKRILVIKQLQYIIPQWTGDGYPNVIYIDAQVIPGYKDAYGQASGHIAALQIQEMAPSVDQSGIKSIDLKYNLKSAVNWQIPSSLQFLYLTVKVDTDTTDMILPLPNIMMLTLDIVTQK